MGNTLWASWQKYLSSGFKTRSYLNQPSQLQRQARNFTCIKLRYDTLQRVHNKGVDQTVQMHRLVSAFVVRKRQNAGFLLLRPISFLVQRITSAVYINAL